MKIFTTKLLMVIGLSCCSYRKIHTDKNRLLYLFIPTVQNRLLLAQSPKAFVNHGSSYGSKSRKTYRKNDTEQNRPSNAPKSPSGYRSKSRKTRQNRPLDQDRYPHDSRRKSRDPRQDLCPHDWRMRKNYRDKC